MTGTEVLPGLPPAATSCREQAGTIAGFARHRRAGEYPCPDCVDGNRTWHREYKRARADAVAVARAVTVEGDRPLPFRLNRRELHAALDRLDAQGGLSSRVIAARVGCAQRTVVRRRAARRRAAA